MPPGTQTNESTTFRLKREENNSTETSAVDNRMYKLPAWPHYIIIGRNNGCVDKYNFPTTNNLFPR